jgi:hypothetical protein
MLQELELQFAILFSYSQPTGAKCSELTYNFYAYVHLFVRMRAGTIFTANFIANHINDSPRFDLPTIAVCRPMS